MRGFASYALKPVGAAPGKKLHGKLADAIDRNLTQCMAGVFKDVKPYDQTALATQPRPLVIEPVIVDIKAVSVAKRIFLGPFPGSSAALMKVRFIDHRTGTVVADPTFYSKGSAWGGAFTFGTTDNLMMTRLANRVCDYSTQNF